ncbi:hypothetical protein PVAP13_9NG195646 [Panicum virgatum]|uniref:Uncharacterized protein n=1 Tax=Panicum virgatum TaxID=38727 RepID=A0A8T0MIE7_PANVG|nr:hypothetical protein PVAP13_9NG195646 [Panicum virgatum]
MAVYQELSCTVKGRRACYGPVWRAPYLKPRGGGAGGGGASMAGSREAAPEAARGGSADGARRGEGGAWCGRGWSTARRGRTVGEGEGRARACRGGPRLGEGAGWREGLLSPASPLVPAGGGGGTPAPTPSPAGRLPSPGRRVGLLRRWAVAARGLTLPDTSRPLPLPASAALDPVSGAARR